MIMPKRHQSGRLPVTACCLALLAALAWPLAAADKPKRTERPEQAVNKTAGIAWARAGNRQLLLDIYTPAAAKGLLPVLLIYHGGGWLVNDRTIMDDMAAWVAAHGQRVVVNADYRLLGDNDSSTTLPQIAGDCLGALAWTKSNIARFGGDPGRVAVTGDSAGGHLAAMVALAGWKAGDQEYGPPDFGFVPTWLPAGKQAKDLDWSVQALAMSYGVADFYATCKGGFEGPGNGFWGFGKAKPHQVIRPGINVKANPDWYKGLSPLHLIPQAAERSLPPIFCQVGSNDMVVNPQSVKTFVAALQKAGHRQVSYREYPGKGHAYLDKGSGFKALATEPLTHLLDFLDTLP